MDIGRILKPQGIRGEVKVEPLTDDSSRFCVLKTVSVGTELKKIQSVRISGGFVYIKFGGVDDRNAAELLRGRFISVDRASSVPLEFGEFFIADLIGAELGSSRVGKISAVRSFGAADVVEVNCENGKGMSFAFVKALDPKLEDGIFTVDKARLDEVAVYED